MKETVKLTNQQSYGTFREIRLLHQGGLRQVRQGHWSSVFLKEGRVRGVVQP
jgi:hypothetical protein